MSKIAGRATIYIDGKKMFVGSSYSYTLGDVTRSDSIGESGVAGFVEKAVAPKVSVELINTPDSPTDGVDKVTNATIVLDLLDGSAQYTWFGCWYSGDPFETDQDGRGTAEFHSATPAKRTK